MELEVVITMDYTISGDWINLDIMESSNPFFL